MTTTNRTRRAGDEMAAVSTCVRDTREALGLSRIQLSVLAGCSLTHVTNIEAGAVPRRSVVLERILHALNDVAMNGEEPPRQHVRR